jgi:hypothetical protein
MPIHINQIITNSKPLDKKVFEFLAADPDQFYTTQEIQNGLGESDGFTQLGSKLGIEWMVAGMVADMALAVTVPDELEKNRREKQGRYTFALLSLVCANRIQCVNYRGVLRFGVTKVLPDRLEKPTLSLGL